MRSEAHFEMTDSQPGRTDIPDGEEGAERAKLRVVIVEDSAIIRARLAEALSEIPNVEIVGQVETEAEALAILRQAKWDAAVLDLQLKQGTGLGVLKSLAQGTRPANTQDHRVHQLRVSAVSRPQHVAWRRLFLRQVARVPSRARGPAHARRRRFVGVALTRLIGSALLNARV